MLGDPGYIDILDGGDTGDAMAEDFDGLIFRPNFLYSLVMQSEAR